MTLDEAIKIYTSNAEYERTHGCLQGYLNFRQLAGWLKDYKRLKEQEPKTGRWIITCKSNITGFSIKTCSICNTQALEISKYCPNCGAKMVEPQERSEE